MNQPDSQDPHSDEAAAHSFHGVLFDVTQLQELMGGDKAFVEELINLYLEEVPERLARFLGHCEADQAHPARLEIHSIKGSSATIGAKRMSEVAWEIERRLRAEEPIAAIQGFIPALQRTFRETEAAMRAALDSL